MMDDSCITLAIICKKLVNVEKFTNWFVENFQPNYHLYLECWKDEELTGFCLTDFEYQFLTNSFAWKGLITL